MAGNPQSLSFSVLFIVTLGLIVSSGHASKRKQHKHVFNVKEGVYTDLPLIAPTDRLVSVWTFHLQLDSPDFFLPKLFLAYPDYNTFGGRGIAKLPTKRDPKNPHHPERKVKHLEESTVEEILNSMKRHRRDVSDNLDTNMRGSHNNLIHMISKGASSNFLERLSDVDDTSDSNEKVVLPGLLPLSSQDIDINEGSGWDDGSHTKDPHDMPTDVPLINGDFPDSVFTSIPIIPKPHVPMTRRYTLTISYHGITSYVCRLTEFMGKELSEVTITAFPTSLILGSDVGSYSLQIMAHRPLIPHRIINFVPLPQTDKPIVEGAEVHPDPSTTTHQYPPRLFPHEDMTLIDGEKGNGSWQDPTPLSEDGTSWIPLLVILGGVCIAMTTWVIIRRRKNQLKANSADEEKTGENEEFCECNETKMTPVK